MGEFWYLWRVEASADFMPVSIGCLRTTADQVEVVSLEDEAVLAELAYLKEAEALKLRWSERDGEAIATHEALVAPGDPRWPEAVVRNLGASTGIRVTATPSFF